MAIHSALTGAALHSPWHYVQETDPGAVGAGQVWFKKSTKVLSYRNDANDGWITILTSSNSQALPNGTDWSGFMAAYDALDPGDTLVLPNDVLVQEDQLEIRKAIAIIGGGPNSKILVDELDISNHIWIGYGDGDTYGDYLIPHVTLADFEIEHNRTNVTRSLALSVYNGSSNVHIRNITFTNITSDCVIVRNEGGDPLVTEPDWKIIQGVYVTHCTANEWYESFFNHREGSASNMYVMYNTCNVSLAHPNGAISRPYAAVLNQEEEIYDGLIENVHISNNTFVSTLAGGAWTDSIGTKIGQSAPNPGTLMLRFHRIYITNNLYQGWNRLLQIVTTNTADGINGTPVITAGRSYIYVFGNTFKWGADPMAEVNPATVSTSADPDKIFIGDNDFIQSNVAHTPVATPYDWTDPADVDIIEDPPNRTTPP